MQLQNLIPNLEVRRGRSVRRRLRRRRGRGRVGGPTPAASSDPGGPRMSASAPMPSATPNRRPRSPPWPGRERPGRPRPEQRTDHGRHHGSPTATAVPTATGTATTEPGDDNSSESTEPGDDNGTETTEPGDDNGSESPEPGDDNGGHHGDNNGPGDGDNNGAGDNSGRPATTAAPAAMTTVAPATATTTAAAMTDTAATTVTARRRRLRWRPAPETLCRDTPPAPEGGVPRPTRRAEFVGRGDNRRRPRCRASGQRGRFCRHLARTVAGGAGLSDHPGRFDPEALTSDVFLALLPRLRGADRRRARAAHVRVLGRARPFGRRVPEAGPAAHSRRVRSAAARQRPLNRPRATRWNESAPRRCRTCWTARPRTIARCSRCGSSPT